MVDNPLEKTLHDEHTHTWLKQVHISYVPGDAPTPLANEVAGGILKQFHLQGHVVQEVSDNSTGVLLTTAPYGEPLSWRKSLQLLARSRYKLDHTPTVFTLVHVQEEELSQVLAHLESALSKEEPDPKDYEFPGLTPKAYRVLHKQGQRAGPLLALERMTQAQAMCLNVLLLVGDDKPDRVYHFDLVGAYPYSSAEDESAFYKDIVLRMVTRVSTHEITDHQPVGEPVPREVWESLSTPEAMFNAARELDKRGFFTELVRISDMVAVPAVEDAISSQYSEGCFATWDPTISALITTITGSARPVNKGDIGEDDLAVITGIRPDNQGALVRHIEGKPNYPPSSEAVEMIEIDNHLPQVTLESAPHVGTKVPVIRSKLHGHRGIAAYDPRYVEYITLDPPYYQYPVTCATAAQSHGISLAFGRSQALNDPDDPRQVAFTVLPTHGIVIAEKWVAGKAPFQVIWEYFDAGYLVPEHPVPQGSLTYAEDSGMMVLRSS